MATETKIRAYWNPKTGETCPPHIIGTDEDGDTLYLVRDGFEPVTPYWLDEDGHAHADNDAHNRTYRAAVVGEVSLTDESQAHLDTEALLDAAEAQAREARIDVARPDIRITTWTE